MRPPNPHQNSFNGQIKVQLCILMQISIKLYGDGRKYNSFATFLQSTGSYKVFMYKHRKIRKIFLRRRLNIEQAPILNLTHLKKLNADTTLL
jgi:hypothetical protein